MTAAKSTKRPAPKPGTLAQMLAYHGACHVARAWAKAHGHTTPAAAWDACGDVAWLCWSIDALGLTKKYQRELRLFSCWCVRETPLHDGRKVWDLLRDDRSRKAVEVAEKYARGKATDAELTAATADATTDAAQAKAFHAIVGNPFRTTRQPR